MSLHPSPGPLSIPAHIIGPLIRTCNLGPVSILITAHASICYWDPCLSLLSGSPPISVPTTRILTSSCYEILACTCYSELHPYLSAGAPPDPTGTWWVRSAVLAAWQSCRTTRPVPASTSAVATCAPVPRSPDTSTADPGSLRAPPPSTYLRVPAGAVSGGRHRRPVPCPDPAALPSPVPDPALTAAASTAPPRRFPP